MSTNRIDAAIAELFLIVEAAEAANATEAPCIGCGRAPQHCECGSQEHAAEIAREHAERNAWIDEQRERDRLADEAWDQRMVELEEERRQDQ